MVQKERLPTFKVSLLGLCLASVGVVNYYLQVVADGVTNKDLVLDDCRHYLLALLKRNC